MTDDDHARHMEDIFEQLQTHDHGDLAEAGLCSHCRPLTIEYEKDAPHASLLLFFEPGGSPDRPDALALVRSWDPDPDGAFETAWATGCNPGTNAAWIDHLDEMLIARSGIPPFTLIAGRDAAGAALDDYYAALAELSDGAGEHLRKTLGRPVAGEVCSDCGLPMGEHEDDQ